MRRPRFGWRPLLGLALIIGGLSLSWTFITPYLQYFFAPAMVEADHSLEKDENRILIPSIKLNAPLVADTAADNEGIVMPYEISFGAPGNTVLEGHNIAKNGRPLFSLLYLVRLGDEVIIHFEGRRYVYIVKKRSIIDPKLKANFIKAGRDDHLTLITCYPPTRTFMRLILIAEPEKKPRPG